MVEDLTTFHLDVKFSSQVGSIYDRPVSFQVQSVCVYSLSGGGVQILNHDRHGISSIQDGNGTEQENKAGSVTTSYGDP